MDITPFTTPLLQIGGTLLMFAAPVVITRAFKWLGVQDDATAQAAAQAIVQAAAGQVYHAAVINNASLSDVVFRNKAMNAAMVWACRNAPNAEAIMAKAGWDQGHVQGMLIGEVGKLLALDPAASATMPDDQFLHAPTSAVQPVANGEGINLGAAVRQAGIVEPFVKTPVPVTAVGDNNVKKAIAFLFGLGLLGLSACVSNAPVPVSFSSIVAQAQPVVVAVEASAKVALTSGLVKPADAPKVQLALDALDVANAALSKPSVNQKQAVQNLVNAADAVVQLIPTLPPDVKLGATLLDVAVTAYLSATP